MDRRTGEHVAMILGQRHALVIADKDGAALDAAVGHRCTWSHPAAWYLAYVMVRMPDADRERIIGRLTVAGLARTVTHDDVSRHFKLLW